VKVELGLLKIQALFILIEVGNGFDGRGCRFRQKHFYLRAYHP
jgi:hypothetical protein